MSIARCPNGHYYDSEKDRDCPYCREAAGAPAICPPGNGPIAPPGDDPLDLLTPELSTAESLQAWLRERQREREGRISRDEPKRPEESGT